MALFISCAKFGYGFGLLKNGTAPHALLCVVLRNGDQHVEKDSTYFFLLQHG